VADIQYPEDILKSGHVQRWLKGLPAIAALVLLIAVALTSFYSIGPDEAGG